MAKREHKHIKKVMSVPPKNSKQKQFYQVVSEFNQDISESILVTYLTLLGLGGKIGNAPIWSDLIRKEIEPMVDWRSFVNHVNSQNILSNWASRTVYFRAHSKWESKYDFLCKKIKDFEIGYESLAYHSSFTLKTRRVRNSLIHGLNIELSGSRFEIQPKNRKNTEHLEGFNVSSLSRLIKNNCLYVEFKQIDKSEVLHEVGFGGKNVSTRTPIDDNAIKNEMIFILSYFISVSRVSVMLISRLFEITGAENIEFNFPKSADLEYSLNLKKYQASLDDSNMSDLAQWFYYSVIINFVQFWENNYRKNLAKINRVKVRQIQSEYMFHLVKIRNSIAHCDGYDADERHADYFGIKINKAGRYVIGFKDLQNIRSKTIDLFVNPYI